MEKIVDYNAYKKEWLAELEKNYTVADDDLSYKFPQKLFSQWLEIDENDEEILPLNIETGFSFAYYHEGSPDEENSNEEYIWYIVWTDFNKKGQAEFVANYRNLLNLLKSVKNPPEQENFNDKNLFKISEFLNKVKKNPLLYKIIVVIATGVDDSILEYENSKDQIEKDKSIEYNFQIEIVSIKTIFNRNVDENTRSEIFSIEATLAESGQNLLVGSIKILDLYKFLRNYKLKMGDIDLIYQKNVRRYLGSINKVNKEIRKTILENPERFGLFNNGITMVVGDFEKDQLLNNSKGNLMEPYIVNGCQTSRTIWDTLNTRFRDKNRDSFFDDWVKELNSCIVTLKIVNIGSGQNSKNLLRDITKYTNSQSAVKTSDFISLETDFNNFHKELASKFNLYLEIQKGGYLSQLAKQKANPDIKPFFQEHEFCNAFDLIKVYSSAWLEQPGKASRSNPPFAPGGSIFVKITSSENPDRLTVEDMYASYLLHREANEIGFSKKNDTIAWKSRTRHLFYYTVTQILKTIIGKANLGKQQELKILTKSIMKIFIEFPDIKQELINSCTNILEEYMTKVENTEEQKEKSRDIYSEPLFEKKKDLKDFFNDDTLGKTENFSYLLSVQLSTMKRPVNGIKPYDIILDKIKELKV